jgi:hypothetical protein
VSVVAVADDCTSPAHALPVPKVTVDAFDAPATKFDAVTVRLKAPLPVPSDAGLSSEIWGAFTYTLPALDTDPPGSATVTANGEGPLGVTTRLEVTARSISVELRTVTLPEGCATPFQFTVSPLTKPVPLIARVNAGLPAVQFNALLTTEQFVEVVLSPVMVGGGPMVRVSVGELVNPPGSCTLTETEPWVVSRLPEIVTARLVVPVTVIPLLMVVGVPPAGDQMTLSPATKPVPVMVSVKPALPAATVLGERCVAVGRTVNGVVLGLEVAPPGFTTSTWLVPTDATQVAGINTVSVVEVADVCVIPEHAPPLVPKVTVDPDDPDPTTKFDPVTVNEKALAPAPTELGVRPLVEILGPFTTNTFAEPDAVDMAPSRSMTVTAMLAGA